MAAAAATFTGSGNSLLARARDAAGSSIGNAWRLVQSVATSPRARAGLALSAALVASGCAYTTYNPYTGATTTVIGPPPLLGVAPDGTVVPVGPPAAILNDPCLYGGCGYIGGGYVGGGFYGGGGREAPRREFRPGPRVRFDSRH